VILSSIKEEQWSIKIEYFSIQQLSQNGVSYALDQYTALIKEITFGKSNGIYWCLCLEMVPEIMFGTR